MRTTDLLPLLPLLASPLLASPIVHSPVERSFAPSSPSISVPVSTPATSYPSNPRRKNLPTLPIHRRALNIQRDGDDLFSDNDAAVIRQEMQVVRSKYQKAAGYLANVQLAQVDVPDLDDLADQAANLSSIVALPSSTLATTPSSTAEIPSMSASASATSALLAPSTSVVTSAALPSVSSGPAAAPSAHAVETDDTKEKRGGGSGAVPLTDWVSGSLDVLYYGPLSIGTSAQSLTVDFDTGSADLWLPVNCSNCASTQFNSSASSSFVNTGQSFSVQYGSGSVQGTLAQETVSLAGLGVNGQYFGAVSSESDDFHSNPNSGVLGMAFSSIANSGEPTLFENLVKSGKVANSYFGFHLTRRQTQGSQLCIGCYDSSKFTSSISWIPVVSQTYWSVSMTGFSAKSNNQNALSKSIVAAIDTGTTLIYAPSSIADAFYQQIPGSSKASQFGDGFYQFPCQTNAKVSISFNNVNFPFAMADFNLGKTGSGSSMCVGGVLGMSDGLPNNLAIVGDEFLKSWYSIYDTAGNSRVGLAASTNSR